VGRVRILECDPDLGSGLDRSNFEVARARCTAELVVARRVAGFAAVGQADELGLLVLRGTLLHRLRLAGRETVELLGAGDVVRPWPAPDDLAELLNPGRWVVLDETELGVLDRVYVEQSRPWPELSAGLAQRVERRLRSLLLRLAVAQIPQLEMRLRLVLWDLADRLGRVDREGVFVPVQLRQDVLAGLVCASRAAVGRALGELQRRGTVTRDRRGWRLGGAPPDELFAGERPDGAAGPPGVLTR
jgi:CRP/FNR family transcriptional regulator, cyclic AMP receptor protein